MAEQLDEIVASHEAGAPGLPWLPTYVLDDEIEGCEDSREDDHRLFSKRRSVVNDGMEACGEENHRFYSKEKNYYNKYRHQPPSDRDHRKPPAVGQSPLLASPPHWKSHLKPDQKPKHLTNWATGGPGMQAVFLDSGQRSCGTGVFLPRTAETDVQKPRKPAFAPVLLPSRVVQALNLNVHGLGLQIKPREDNNHAITKGSKYDRIRNKKNRDVPNQICVISQNQRSSSPEIFLPKEWTY